MRITKLQSMTVSDDKLTVYHYTEIENWNQMKQGTWRDEEVPGLEPRLSLSRNTGEEHNISCSFALLEPEPEEWTKNEEYKDIWSCLMNNTGPLLVEVDITNHTDSAFVVDWAKKEQYRVKPGEKLGRQKLIDAERAYVDTKIPLLEYLENKDELQYKLPEVIITKTVPIQDVRLAEEQPKLVERLNWYRKGSGPYKSIKRRVAEIKELWPWAAKQDDEDLHAAIQEQAQLEEEYASDL